LAVFPQSVTMKTKELANRPGAHPVGNHLEEGIDNQLGPKLLVSELLDPEKETGSQNAEAPPRTIVRTVALGIDDRKERGFVGLTGRTLKTDF